MSLEERMAELEFSLDLLWERVKLLDNPIKLECCVTEEVNRPGYNYNQGDHA